MRLATRNIACFQTLQREIGRQIVLDVSNMEFEIFRLVLNPFDSVLLKLGFIVHSLTLPRVTSQHFSRHGAGMSARATRFKPKADGR
jgi:hypothetical protein